jgi:hypothetical protein
MKRVPITEVEAGHVVARPVATSSGMIMVQPGAALTPEIISRLVDLGIDAIWVEGVSADAKPMDAVLAELDQRFAGHANDSLMMELKAVIAGCITAGASNVRD